MSREYIVFTDLDGSLLNHVDYSYGEAKSMLEYIKTEKIPLIFNTSKTEKECRVLQKKMGINAPFIVENGACIYYEDGRVELIGALHVDIKSFIDSIKKQYKILPLSDMSIEKILDYTNLDYSSAKLAKNREFSEPFLLSDLTLLKEIELLAKSSGFKILRGGRFYHCVAAEQDKGIALKRVMKNYRDKIVVAIGDNYNDIPMLEVANKAILIPYEEKKYIECEIKNLIKADDIGAFGWNQALESIFLKKEQDV